jgi:hypothetical protein
MKCLLDKSNGYIYDVVDDSETFEVYEGLTETDGLKWITLDAEFESMPNVGLRLDENGKQIRQVMCPPGGNPNLQKNFDLRNMTVEWNGNVYNADKASQEAMTRNAFVHDSFEWVTDENTIVMLTVAQAKEILVLMTNKSTQIIKDYQDTVERLEAEGYDLMEISNNRGESIPTSETV